MSGVEVFDPKNIACPHGSGPDVEIATGGLAASLGQDFRPCCLYPRHERLANGGDVRGLVTIRV